MKQVPLNKIKDDLSNYLRLAEKEDIIITRHGKPAGYLVGFADEDDWIDYLILNDPKFQERLKRSLRDVREGRVVSLEQLRASSTTPSTTHGNGKSARPPMTTSKRRNRRKGTAPKPRLNPI